MRRYLIGAVLGVLAFGLLRFAFAPFHQPTHYHANFEIFIDGEPLDLSDDRYMEEVGACKAGDTILPSERVHMHAGEDAVVHVHHEGVTWGHFLSVLGFSMGDDHLILDDNRRLFSGEDGRTLTFVLDGFVVPSPHDQLIRSADRFLVSYGNETEEELLERQFEAVPANAEEYNERDDPPGCAGPAELGPWDRLVRALWG